MPREISGFYFITDSNLTRHGAFEDSEDAIRGGARIIQYREKSKPYGERASEARRIAEACASVGVAFIVNDDLQLALDVKADGLHIGPLDMAPAEARKRFQGILGVSCSNVAEVAAAEWAGADYIAASPVFFTPTKNFEGYGLNMGVGLEGIAEFRKATGLPIVAIGGIKLENVSEIILSGADAACAISATVATGNVEKSVRDFAEAIESALKSRRIP